jgi:N-acetylmuramoyl-L-alanine amidase
MKRIQPGKAALLAVFLYGMSALCSAQQLVIDTGHSTEKPGATGPAGKREFDLNRQLAVALIKALRAQGAQVTDVAAAGSPLSLQARTKASSGAALFVSIHHDSIPASKYNLYEMCMYLSEHLTWQVVL